MDGIRRTGGASGGRVTRNVTPRDIGDWPVCTALALFFWFFAALFLLAPVLAYLLVGVVSVMWAQPLPSPWPAAWATVGRCALAAMVLVPLGFVPGMRRLALNARLAVLGFLACLLPAGIFLVTAGTRG